MRITKAQATKIGNKLNIDFNVISVETLRQGMTVELEHGKRRGITNITNDNLLLSAKIALAHLIEFPDYYEELELMEGKLKKKWKGKRKPSVFKK